MDILNYFKTSSVYKELVSSFLNNSKINIKGVSGSFANLLMPYIHQSQSKNIVFIFSDKEEAIYALNDAEAILGKENVLFYPDSHITPYQIEEVQNANVVLRTEVLNKISSANHYYVVTYADAVFEKVITNKKLSSISFLLKKGQSLNLSSFNEKLFELDFRRVDFVTEPGEFSLRGGILDIFSYSYERPFRISFFGDEIESIREFDIETQLSISVLEECNIVPNIDKLDIEEQRVPFFDYLEKDTSIVTKDFVVSLATIEKKYEKAEEIYSKLDSNIQRKAPQELYATKESISESVTQLNYIEFSSKPYWGGEKTIVLNQTEQPAFHKQFDLIAEDLQNKEKEKYTSYISFNSDKQEERLKEIFGEKKVNFDAININISRGFIDIENKFLLYTDHQIFDRFHRYNARNSFAKSEALTLKELTELKVGDYVTHIDHGVGKFMGLVKIKNDETIQETIKLVYKNNDILYVNIYSLHKISKFSGKDGAEVTLNQLGSPAWKNLKNKAKSKVKEVAFDLIKLYSERKSKQGFEFSPDGYLQNELEASFVYEDTPDQEKATADIKADMEKPIAMDRLVCGDVGFGKTEVAIRAAFKAATDGKQVAILVPTTILALQHHKTFSKRLKDFPVTIEYLNRFKSTKAKNEILKGLEQGKIDIVIGTHQLVGKDVKFKDIGLLIIDEEQKFGVSVKDKLKTIKTTVDTLTLTATPIPRTLQFSLMAARDLSVIKTPPPNRQPIHTELVGLSEETIRDAIQYEIQRGGQVYFINNRVENLINIAGMIQRLVPEAKVVTGHGQMEGKKLEKVMIDFMEGEYDVLVATTIVESGLDVPNANIIFINDAQNFGLADLHQMRGRVGRSNRKAFCYLITPPLDVLTNEAKKRLQAIEQFSDLGSGFNIAMKDLEIRGAGDLLGANQSGFFAEIGFETYQQILNEAVQELKENEFSDLFKEENENKEFISEVQVDTDFELLIPDEYVNSVEERFSLYQKMSELEEVKEVNKFGAELKDRFGGLPQEVLDLLESIKLKFILKEIGIEKVIVKNNTLLAYFLSDAQSRYFQSDIFMKLIHFVQNNPRELLLKEKETKEGRLLYIRKEGIKNVHDLVEFFGKVGSFVL